MLRIGCHLSNSKGYVVMLEQALDIGANTFQFFTRNPRGSKIKDINFDDINRFNALVQKHNFNNVLGHAPYTLNPASPDNRVLDFAYLAIKEDISRMELIPGNYYNMHPGCCLNSSVDEGIKRVIDLLNDTITEDMTTTILIETMAGKGTEIGKTFQEVQLILDGLNFPDKAGVCLDTCHVFDAGYNIKDDLDGVLNEFDKAIGIDKLYAIHLNDSKNPFSSHKDRHEKIGQGSLGINTFVNIINHKKLKDKVFILETPNEIEGYANEIKTLSEQFFDI